MKTIRNLSLFVLGILTVEVLFRIPKYCWAGCPEAWLGYAKLGQLILVSLLAFKAHQAVGRRANKAF